MNARSNNGPVVGFGLIGEDYVAVVPSWERDQKVEATGYFEQIGGPVPVALTAIARLGHPSPISYMGVVGVDPAADALDCLLREQGVDPAHMTCAPGATTGKSLVLLDQRDGSRTLASYSRELPPMEFTPAQEALIASARLLHLDGRDLPASLRAAQIARASGGIVSIDLGTMRPGRERLLALCDIVLASRKGGAGAFPDAPNDPEEQVRRFLSMGATIAGVTLAHEGVVIASRNENGGQAVRLPPFRVENVVDTCGAGDTFHGGFLWAFLQGWDVAACADWAQASVALRIQKHGNRAGLPTRTEVEAFLAADPARG